MPAVAGDPFRDRGLGRCCWSRTSSASSAGPRERGADAQAFFASAATRWDKLRDELYGRAFPAAAMAALLPAGWTVADLGCGTAQMAATVAPHVKRVIGVDQSAAMLKAARKRVAGLANVELRQGELLALPIEDGACDGALMTLVLGYLPDPAPALAESFRVLAPGGRLVAIDVMRHDREEFARQMGHANLGFEPDALAGLLTSAGFEEIAVRPLPPEAGGQGALPQRWLHGTRPLPAPVHKKETETNMATTSCNTPLSSRRRAGMELYVKRSRWP